MSVTNFDFTTGADGFVYADDIFRSTSEGAYADGEATGGVLRVELGGQSGKDTITDISGGWSTTFDTQAGQTGTITLSYRITMTGDFDTGEFGEVLIAVDGVETSVATLAATDDDNETLDTGFVTVSIDLGQLSPGTHTLNLGGYVNQRTRPNEIAVIEFDSVSLDLSAPGSPADDDGNLSLTTTDLALDGNEAPATVFTVTGIDADATALVTVTDSLGATVTGNLATDGTVTLDLSTLADGNLTTSVTATDINGATATVAGPALTLVPATGDDDGDLALTAADVEIDATEVSAVELTVSGIDADATSVVTVMDSQGATVTGNLAADGTVTLDLSSLTDGNLTTTVTATDANGATATVPGAALTLNTAPVLTAIDADFATGADGFVYSDDLFRGTSEGNYADGVAADGVLRVELGGQSGKDTITDISGGWSQTFDTLAGQSGTLTLSYRITLSGDFDAGEYGEVLVSVDGVETSIATLAATDDDNETLDTGFVSVTLDLGQLTPGTHTLNLGGYVNERTRPNEVAVIEFDSVSVDLTAAGSPADDDGNLTLTTTDLALDGNEAPATVFTVSGIDADATAVVTVTDSFGATVTGNLATDGTVTLDLSTLADGNLTTSVTATDINGATATVAGPAMTLVPPTGDDDGNLALTALDVEIDAAEAAAVEIAVSGIDADAAAVVTVTDSLGATVTGNLAADGTVTLDLSSLTDGNLTTSVTATDANGATATVAGPALTLDTAPVLTAIDADFATGAEGFVYSDDLFRGTAEGNYADGVAADGVLRVELGGQSGKDTITDISGGWSSIFDTQPGQSGTLTLSYRITLSGDFDAGEFGEVLIAVDGVETSIATLAATDDDNETLDTGFVSVTLDLGQFSPGTHTLDLGGYVNQRTRPNEVAVIEFDSVSVDLTAAGSPADDDGNLTLTTTDLALDGNEAPATVFTVSGIDADATAVVTVTDDFGATVTGNLASDGTVTLDLSTLADGNLTTSVTATDINGATATVAGPAMTLVPPTGDDDGNLALTALDVQIDATEVSTVELAVSGIDADATSVVTVMDSQGATVTGNLAADGTVTLDLSALTDGNLTTSVTATDANGATATVPGPALTLDTTQIDISFENETRALSIDLENGQYGYAATVMPIGDSLTLGVINDDNTPEEEAGRAFLEGYRGDFFEELLAQDIWIDYVGFQQNGPTTMLDSDHSGQPGVRFDQITGVGQPADLSDNLANHDPDIVILMAGTNDFNGNQSSFLNKMSNLSSVVNTAVNQFQSFAGSEDKHLVVSLIPPKIISGSVDFSEFYNEGYSVVNGDLVVGDVGNGSYVAGLRALWEAAENTHGNVHLFDPGFDFDPNGGYSDLSPDGVHLKVETYDSFAANLTTFIETEIGFAGGTINGADLSLGGAGSLRGGQAGDMINGSAQADSIRGDGGNDAIRGRAGDDVLMGDDGNDRLEGNGGVDQLFGGDGGDTFVFGLDFSQGFGIGDQDRIEDFGNGADLIVLDNAFFANSTVRDATIPGAVVLELSDGGSVSGEVFVSGASAELLKGAALGNGQFELATDGQYLIGVQTTDEILHLV